MIISIELTFRAWACSPFSDLELGKAIGRAGSANKNPKLSPGVFISLD
jgi:hypothetical protein